MSKNKKKCVWYEQCGGRLCRGCEFFDTLDYQNDEIKYYKEILLENAKEYKSVVDEISGEDFYDR